VREKNEIVIALGGEALQGTVQLIHRGGQSWRLLLRDALP
jgi:coenzyme F420-reducing hydrogenase gamma subunit